MTIVRRGFVVRGKVQGVAFRAFTREAAQRCGVSGFVANVPDRSVRGECQGTGAEVEAFLEAVRRGSPWSRVERVEVTELEPRGDDQQDFVIRR